MISTFNFWFIVAPLTWVIARLLAFASVTNDGIKAKKRVSNLVWTLGAIVYTVVVWLTLSKLFISESILGMIEFLGRNNSKSGTIARAIFYVVAAIWAGFVCWNATRARQRYYNRIENDYSLATKKVAARKKPVAKKNRQAQTPKAENILFYDFEKKAFAKSEPTDEQKRAIQYRVQKALEDYTIVDMDNTEVAYTDNKGKKRPIAEYLPTGVYSYFVAVNLKDESEAPLFLGSGSEKKAKANLKRYLEEKIKAQICASKRKSKPAINQ